MQQDAKTERRSRHDALFVAIDNDLSHAVGKLEALRDTIAGSEKPTGGGGADAPKSPTPAPAEVYESSPGKIMELSQRIGDLTTDIRNVVA